MIEEFNKIIMAIPQSTPIEQMDLANPVNIKFCMETAITKSIATTVHRTVAGITTEVDAKKRRYTIKRGEPNWDDKDQVMKLKVKQTTYKLPPAGKDGIDHICQVRFINVIANVQ